MVRQTNYLHLMDDLDKVRCLIQKKVRSLEWFEDNEKSLMVEVTEPGVKVYFRKKNETLQESSELQKHRWLVFDVEFIHNGNVVGYYHPHDEWRHLLTKVVA